MREAHLVTPGTGPFEHDLVVAPEAGLLPRVLVPSILESRARETLEMFEINIQSLFANVAVPEPSEEGECLWALFPAVVEPASISVAVLGFDFAAIHLVTVFAVIAITLFVYLEAELAVLASPVAAWRIALASPVCMWASISLHE